MSSSWECKGTFNPSIHQRNSKSPNLETDGFHSVGRRVWPAVTMTQEKESYHERKQLWIKMQRSIKCRWEIDRWPIIYQKIYFTVYRDNSKLFSSCFHPLSAPRVRNIICSFLVYKDRPAFHSKSLTLFLQCAQEAKTATTQEGARVPHLIWLFFRARRAPWWWTKNKGAFQCGSSVWHKTFLFIAPLKNEPRI